MNIISEPDFLKKKTSNTIFVLGSSYGINSVTKDDWNVIRKHDSISFNWFCFHGFEPTFYIVREQANIPSRVNKKAGETPENFVKHINRYTGTCGIIVTCHHHTPEAYRYDKESSINLDCVILKDNNKAKCVSKMHYMDKNPFEFGNIHGKCSLYNVLHLVRYLSYDTIVFVGVDLYDSRYFWLDPKVTRYTVANKNKNKSSTHAITSVTKRLVKRFNAAFDVNMYVYNKKSLLNDCIKFRSIGSFA